MPTPPRDLYSHDFFTATRDESRRTASVVVPIVFRWVRPESVADVGCGIGTWLAEFQANGVQDILGIDGDYVPRELLQIPQERFVARDLSKPFEIGRRFDLAVSLEVAEHLPAASAAGLVDSLTALAPVVLFSAAIPFQGGTNHINEQWPEYWAKLFRERGFHVIDCVREAIWTDPQVGWWYAQNILFFASEEGLAHFPALRAEHRPAPNRLAIVHPRTYVLAADVTALGVRRLVGLLPQATMRAIRRRWRLLVDR